ncbi:isopentenyl-diphosphate Delta-isomerase [Salinisphaera orenii]|uniref:Isopentenyl-diphosphate Delta-isomerase n=1 Tax=Salinisphaera orenii YIM 95161 TaxID=1051139 RepID=A0A423PDT1_9GAMM|nr:isopentenyl-diphosphate Delta-isomerase [Salinisphaera halophila]ROO23747.1 isopentenyl-diphosphate delta-isomerase [Salinisphaera halophila YIM 95161]
MRPEIDASAAAPVVSFDDEPLIVVDSDDNVLGHMPKAEAHVGEGVLHRAFSIFLFDGDGNTLLQRRADGKQLWGGYWSNSCCSHPRRGESVDMAAVRRLHEELGVNARLSFLYRFEYHARFGEAGSEHEMCSVYAARSDAPVSVNPNEISACRPVAPDTLDAELAAHPERYTPWLKMEWPRIRAAHWDTVEALAAR